MEDQMAPNDTELIQKAQHGDAAAFEQLVYRHDKQVLSIVARFVNCAEDAKDIYQEVFMRVYRGLPKFKLRSEFSTWLYRITTNVCITHRARRKRHSYVSLDDDLEGDDVEPHHQLSDGVETDRLTLNTEISIRVEEALKVLSPHQKLVFTLKHYEGYKLKEIAGMMSCSEGTVKKHLFVATQRMREQLKDLLQ
jgi:RNA polymerase sigma-70 factor (ECF subfamily)